MRVAACFVLIVLIVLLTAQAGTNHILVTTQDFVKATCGENVTLRCHIDEDVTKVLYHWTDGLKTLCNHTSDIMDGIHCSYTEPQKEITLTIEQVELSNSGTYICMVHTALGHGMNQIRLQVSDCSHQPELGKSKHSLNHACVSGSSWICALISLITILRLV